MEHTTDKGYLHKVPVSLIKGMEKRTGLSQAFIRNFIRLLFMEMLDQIKENKILTFAILGTFRLRDRGNNKRKSFDINTGDFCMRTIKNRYRIYFSSSKYCLNHLNGRTGK